MKESAMLLPRTDGQATDSEIEKYQRMTGSLMFSMVETRPDIAFSTSVASRFSKNPSHQHTEAVKTVLKYLKGSRTRGITYGGEEQLKIQGYSDSDWAGDKESRKSTSGYIFMLNGGPVSWCSKRQSTVTLSSTEAEYIALTLAAKEATWLRLLLTELGLLDPNEQHAEIKIREAKTCAKAIEDEGIAQGGGQASMELKGDNQGSIALAHNPVFHARTKQIDIQQDTHREIAPKSLPIAILA